MTSGSDDVAHDLSPLGGAGAGTLRAVAGNVLIVERDRILREAPIV
jgi:hypothetical protein